MDQSSMPTDPFTTWWPYIISLIVGIVTCIRGYLGGVPCPTDTRIDGKVAIVTGASGGIGKEICKELSKRGAHIILCCRSLKKGKDTLQWIKKKQPKALLTLKRLDLTSRKSIEDFVLCLDNIKVDILINNAGVIFHPYKKTEDGHEIHMATNYLGHFILTHLLMKNLKKSDQGRIINVSAGAYQPTNLPLTCEVDSKKYNSKEWYEQSKLALISMTRHMSKILNGSNVTINATNPGMVRSTEHLRHSIIMRSWSVRLSSWPWMWIFMKSPTQGAQTTVYLATDQSLKETSGKFYCNCSEVEISGPANDAEVGKTLYNKTCELLNLTQIQRAKK